MQTHNTPASAMTSPPDHGGEERRPRLAGLDGLRAFAVIAVIAFHLTPAVMPGGALGVDVFFVISGFLITGLLLRERESTGRLNLGHFWVRRARRLLPALAAVVVACGTAAVIIGGDLMVGLGRQILGAATFSSNWLALGTSGDYFADDAPELFRNLWSLAVEEQFYLVWPLLLLALLLFTRRRSRLLVLALAAVASAAAMGIILAVTDDATRVYYGTDTHFFGLALGALLAVAIEHWPWQKSQWPLWKRVVVPIPAFGALAALLILALVLPSGSAAALQGGLFAASALSVVVIAGAVVPGSLLGRGLDWTPLRWIGRRSYGLYLWHWPVLLLVRAAVLPVALPVWGETGTRVAVVATTLVLTLLAAGLSFRFIEQPILDSGFRSWFAAGFRAGPRRLVRTAVAVVAVGAVVAGISVTSVRLATAPTVTSAEHFVKDGEAALEATKPGDPSSDSSSSSDVAAGSGSTIGGTVPADLADLTNPQTPMGTVIPRSSLGPVPPPPGEFITAIGDSVMLASAPKLQESFPGISIDASVSRQMRELPDIVGELKSSHQLRNIVVVGLGTNGPIGRDTLDEVLARIGERRELVVVNVQAPRDWTPGVNETLAKFAADNPNVTLADWHTAIAPHLAILASDQIHPGPTGGGIYSSTVQAAIDELPRPRPSSTLR